MSIYYVSDGDETEMEQRQKIEERQKKRMLSSSIMKELRNEYYEGPEEIRVSFCICFFFKFYIYFIQMSDAEVNRI